MKKSNVKRIIAWLGALAAAAPAWSQEWATAAAGLRQDAEGASRALDKSQAWAQIGRTARGPVDSSGFTCKPDSKKPETELVKARAALKARYPKLPWDQIESVAAGIASQDLAIVLGTDCQHYVFDVQLKALEGATLGGLQCEGKPAIELQGCIIDVTCTEVGRYSRTCGAKLWFE